MVGQAYLSHIGLRMMKLIISRPQLSNNIAKAPKISTIVCKHAISKGDTYKTLANLLDNDTVTIVLFFAFLLLAVVIYLIVSKKDQVKKNAA